MSEGEELYGPGRQRAFSPFLGPHEREQLRSVIDFSAAPAPSFANELRKLARRFVDDGDSLKLRTICLLVADLYEQGWSLSSQADRILIEPPGLNRSSGETVEEIKERVRKTLQAARWRQLQEPSVRHFLERLERSTRRGPLGKTSIADLIDDGRDLAAAFRRANRLGDEDREAALEKIVDPVLEVCESGVRCQETGLLLTDIWRYFRHTWAHEYRSIPGRQMMILIRNAARPKRPVMGIAMLASPVMRLSARDKWIGWLPDAAVERIASGAFDPVAFGRALRARIEESISATRWDDLATASEIKSPTEALVLRLEQRAAGAAAARDAELRAYHGESIRNHSKARPHRGTVSTSGADADWLAASEDLLFVRKRAQSLSQLLFAKLIFREAGLGRSAARAIPSLFSSRDGKRAMEIALAEFRKAGLSSEVADVSICGAVHPYNEILGGKLVALMLASRELRQAYSDRYSGQVSVIASQMAGRAISRSAELKILTTTSLYGVGSSQYNRLVLRAADYPAFTHDLRWGTIGKSLTSGFGTIHLGKETAQALRMIAIARHDARRVNNRFGEGTSPRMRQIREGLDALGIQSDLVLHHATPRIFYGCELLPGARNSLLGLGYADSSSPTTAAVGAAWRHRWLSGRVRRAETLDALEKLGPSSVRSQFQADEEGQFLLDIQQR